MTLYQSKIGQNPMMSHRRKRRGRKSLFLSLMYSLPLFVVKVNLDIFVCVYVYLFDNHLHQVADRYFP